MNDIELLTAVELQLDEAVLALEAIAPTCATHAALIGEALKALRSADALLAGVTLAPQH